MEKTILHLQYNKSIFIYRTDGQIRLVFNIKLNNKKEYSLMINIFINKFNYKNCIILIN